MHQRTRLSIQRIAGELGLPLIIRSCLLRRECRGALFCTPVSRGALIFRVSREALVFREALASRVSREALVSCEALISCVSREALVSCEALISCGALIRNRVLFSL